MTSLSNLLKRLAIHAGVVLAGFALVFGVILIQDQREALAVQDYQSARQQALDELRHARALGMTASEVSDLERQDQTVVEANAPTGTAPFNQARIAFYGHLRDDEVAIRSLLLDREAGLLAETRATAEDGVVRFVSGLYTAQQIGVDPDALKPLVPLAYAVSQILNQSSTIGNYRVVSTQLKAPMSRLALLTADQQSANAVASQFALQVAAIDQGDPALALQSANDTLAQLRADLQTAAVFQLDVTGVQTHVDHLATQLGAAQSLFALEQVAGGLRARSHELQLVMTASLPDKALVISLKEQVIRAYEHGKPVFWTYITTGRPGLETDPGNFKVYAKQSPFVMHSPWPRGSPYWYPDSPIKTVMWFNGADGIHDSPWRAYYGPGTNFPHYDPYGDDNGSHGCVNIPPRNMPWLYNWTAIGTPVIVY